MTRPERPQGGRLVLVAGEASGDALGEELIRALRERRPDLEIAGVGGARMTRAGLDAWHDVSELSVMGLSEVLRHLPRLLRLRRKLARRILHYRPAAFVGIDAPDFNLGLARRLKRRGIRTCQYVSPTIWAWRSGRAARIGEAVDRVLALFPFEPEVYARHGAEARFVGHPTADRLPLEPDRSEARRSLGLPEQGSIIAVLPGSRRSEVQRLGDVLATAVSRMAALRKGLVFATPAAGEETRRMFEAALRRHAPQADLRLFDGQAETVLTAADVGIIASGTAALEALLTKTPMIVVYRVSAVTYFIARKLGMLKIDRYSLPNVLAEEELVPERMQHELEPERLCDDTLALLDDAERRATMVERFTAIHRTLRCDAARRAAEEVLDLMGSQSCP